MEFFHSHSKLHHCHKRINLLTSKPITFPIRFQLSNDTVIRKEDTYRKISISINCERRQAWPEMTTASKMASATEARLGWKGPNSKTPICQVSTIHARRVLMFSFVYITTPTFSFGSKLIYY